jgi:hypothetical protein
MDEEDAIFYDLGGSTEDLLPCKRRRRDLEREGYKKKIRDLN